MLVSEILIKRKMEVPNSSLKKKAGSGGVGLDTGQGNCVHVSHPGIALVAPELALGGWRGLQKRTSFLTKLIVFFES